MLRSAHKFYASLRRTFMVCEMKFVSTIKVYKIECRRIGAFNEIWHERL